MNSLATKIAGGVVALIAVYLVLTNPKGDSAVANSISSGGVPVVKALQGR